MIVFTKRVLRHHSFRLFFGTPMKQNPSHLCAVFLNRTRNTRIERIFTDFLPHPDPSPKRRGSCALCPSPIRRRGTSAIADRVRSKCCTDSFVFFVVSFLFHHNAHKVVFTTRTKKNRTRNTRIERIFTDFLPHPDLLLKGEGVVPCVPRLFVGERRLR